MGAILVKLFWCSCICNDFIRVIAFAMRDWGRISVWNYESSYNYNTSV